jgi:hypothetical protein
VLKKEPAIYRFFSRQEIPATILWFRDDEKPTDTTERGMALKTAKKFPWRLWRHPGFFAGWAFPPFDVAKGER